MSEPAGYLDFDTAVTITHLYVLGGDRTHGKECSNCRWAQTVASVFVERLSKMMHEGKSFEDFRKTYREGG